MQAQLLSLYSMNYLHYLIKKSDYLNFVPLEPWYRYHFHDGRIFDYSSTIEKTNKEISKFEKNDIDGYAKLLKQSKKIFDIGFTKLGDQPFYRFLRWLF